MDQKNNNMISWDYSDLGDLIPTFNLKTQMHAKLEIPRDVLEYVQNSDISKDELTSLGNTISLRHIKNATKKQYYELFGSDKEFYKVDGINPIMEGLVSTRIFWELGKLKYKIFDEKKEGHVKFTGKKDEARRFAKRRDLSRFSKERDVFDVRILRKEDGCASFHLGSMFKATDKEIIKDNVKRKVIVSRIEMPKHYKFGSIGTYAHEVMHCLVDRNKNNMNNYTYEEVLSMFMEKMALDRTLEAFKGSKQYDKLKTEVDLYNVNRYKDTKIAFERILDDYDYYEKQKSKGYTPLYRSRDPKNSHDWEVESPIIHGMGALHAEKLYELYKSETPSGKQRIISSIKKVLEGNKKLDDVLKEEKCDQITLDDVKAYTEKTKKLLEGIPKDRYELKKERKKKIRFRRSKIAKESENKEVTYDEGRKNENKPHKLINDYDR